MVFDAWTPDDGQCYSSLRFLSCIRVLYDDVRHINNGKRSEDSMLKSKALLQD